MALQKPAIVIVPGSFHFPKHFETLISRLQAQGYEAVAVQLASVFLDRSTERAKSHHEGAAAVKKAVQHFIGNGKDVIVMCHSYGGIPATEALVGLGKAEHKNGVLHIIYCCAFVPLPGETSRGIATAAFMGNLPIWNGMEDDGRTRFVRDEKPVIEALYGDVEPSEARKAYADLGLMSPGPSVSEMVGCAWKEIPCTYILCENDKTLPPNVQETLYQKADMVDVVRLKSSHSPFLSMPDEVVKVIDRVAQMYS